MAGTWPCFLDVSSPNLNGTAPFTPMHNLENSLRARTHTSDYRPLREPRATPREVRASTTHTVSHPTASYGQPNSVGAAAANQKQQQQQQQWSMGPRSFASQLSQILVPSQSKLPSPKEQINKYKQMTIRHTMGTTQNML